MTSCTCTKYGLNVCIIIVCLLLAPPLLYWATFFFNSDKLMVDLGDIELPGVYKSAVRNQDGSIDLVINVPAALDVVQRLYERQEMIKRNARLQQELSAGEYKTFYPLTTDSPYVISSPDVCQGVDPLHVLVVVHTAVTNFQRRSLLRETWANKNLLTNRALRIAFMLGLPTDVTTQVMVENEQAVYGDIVQGRFRDTYHNLTHKGVLAFRWIQEYCPHAKLIVKVDDDMFVNPFVLHEVFYKEHSQASRRIVCHVRLKSTSSILRGQNSKWRVEDYEFRGYNHYPVDYCNGYAVLITPDIIRAMFQASRATPFFWVDDVYLYGLLPQRVGDVEYVDIKGNMTLKFQTGLECFKKTVCNLLAVNVRNEGDMLQLWGMALSQASPRMRDTLNKAFLVTA